MNLNYRLHSKKFAFRSFESLLNIVTDNCPPGYMKWFVIKYLNSLWKKIWRSKTIIYVWHRRSLFGFVWFLRVFKICINKNVIKYNWTCFFRNLIRTQLTAMFISSMAVRLWQIYYSWPGFMFHYNCILSVNYRPSDSFFPILRAALPPIKLNTQLSPEAPTIQILSFNKSSSESYLVFTVLTPEMWRRSRNWTIKT